MSYLLVDEFDDSTPIASTFRIQHRGIKVAHLRTHCYKRGVVNGGTFTLTLSQSGNVLATASITADEINALAGTYIHGMFTWTFDNAVHLGVNDVLTEQEYEISFSSSGYTGDPSNLFSVCKDFDNVYIGDYGDHFNDTTLEQKAVTMPYGLELYRWQD